MRRLHSRWSSGQQAHRDESDCNPAPFLRACRTTHQRHSWKDQHDVGRRDLVDEMGYRTLPIKSKSKGMFLYSAVSSPLDRSKRFTLSSHGRTVHSDTVLGFSWTHSSHAAIAQRLFTHISTTVYNQVLNYTAESTEAT